LALMLGSNCSFSWSWRSFSFIDGI
jgi:hypothetical protein